MTYSPGMVAAIADRLGIDDEPHLIVIQAWLETAYATYQFAKSEAETKKYADRVLKVVRTLAELLQSENCRPFGEMLEVHDIIEKHRFETIVLSMLGDAEAEAKLKARSVVAGDIGESIIQTLNLLELAARATKHTGGFAGAAAAAFPGHDPARTRWLTELIDLYELVTGKRAARSHNGGPLLEFIRAAIRIEIPASEWPDTAISSRIHHMIGERNEARRFDGGQNNSLN